MPITFPQIRSLSQVLGKLGDCHALQQHNLTFDRVFSRDRRSVKRPLTERDVFHPISTIESELSEHRLKYALRSIGIDGDQVNSQNFLRSVRSHLVGHIQSQRLALALGQLQFVKNDENSTSDPGNDNVVDLSLYRLRKHLLEAQEVLDAAKRQDSTDDNIVDLAMARFVSSTAVEDLREILDQLQMAIKAFEAKDYQTTKECLEKLKTEHGVFFEVGDFFQLAYSCYKTGDLEEAISYCFEAVDQFPDEPLQDIYIVLAKCFANMNDNLVAFDLSRYYYETAQRGCIEQENLIGAAMAMVGAKSVLQGKIVLRDLEYRVSDGKLYASIKCHYPNGTNGEITLKDTSIKNLDEILASDNGEGKKFIKIYLLLQIRWHLFNQRKEISYVDPKEVEALGIDTENVSLRKFANRNEHRE